MHRLLALAVILLLVFLLHYVDGKTSIAIISAIILLLFLKVH